MTEGRHFASLTFEWMGWVAIIEGGCRMGKHAAVARPLYLRIAQACFMIILLDLLSEFIFAYLDIYLYNNFTRTSIEPCTMQVVARDDELYFFVQVHEVERHRTLMRSYGTLPRRWFSYMIIIKVRDDQWTAEVKDTGVQFGESWKFVLFTFNENIYVYQYPSYKTAEAVYVFREGRFEAVPEDRAAELLKIAAVGPVRSSSQTDGQWGRLLEMKGYGRHTGEFEWHNMRFKCEFANDIIKVTHRLRPGGNRPVREV